jgi:hypothetical protein
MPAPFSFSILLFIDAYISPLELMPPERRYVSRYAALLIMMVFDDVAPLAERRSWRHIDGLAPR